jgi:hypothetical protein
MKPMQLVSLGAMTLVVAGVVYGMVAVQRMSGETRSQAAQAEGVMVYAEPAVLEARVGDQVTVAVKAQSSEAVVGGVLGSVTFDARYLELVNSGPGTFFAETAVTATGSRVGMMAEERVVGSGTVAVLTFKALRPGKSQLEFAPDFALYAADGVTNLLGELPEAVRVEIR